MKGRRVRALCLTALLCSASIGLAQVAPLTSHEFPMPADSGAVLNKNKAGEGQAAERVWSTEIRVPGTPWLRLAFDEAILSGLPELGTGSYLIITSLADGAHQRLNATNLLEWSNTSAYFNGSAVTVELFAYPGTGLNRIRMSHVTGGTFVQFGTDTICGNTDDRTLSTYPANARILPMGCTGWLITNGNCANRFLTAGHCFIPAPASAVVQFNVPLSTAGGSLVNPPPEHQYPVDMASVQATQTVIGNDWSQFFTAANSNTGLHARDAQGGAAYNIGNAPAVATPAQTLRVTGFGTTDPNDPTGGGLPLSQTQVQKTHTGAYTLLSGTRMEYTVDTTGGNSGSPIVNGTSPSNTAIGIHTNAGCGATSGANSGTAIQNAGLQNALANPLGTCATYTAPSCLSTVFGSDNGGSAGGMVYFDVHVAATNDIEITHLLQNVNGAGSSFNIVLYTTPNTHVGKETTPGLWTQVATGSGVGETEDTPALVALSNRVVLRAGRNYGIAIRSNLLGHEYTNGTGANEEFSNTNLRIVSGRASNTAFGTLIIGERVWNGRICYRSNPANSTQCLQTLFAQNNQGSSGGGVYFNANVSAAANLTIAGLSMNAGNENPPGTAFTVSVYTKNGGFAGFEQTPAAWTLRSTGSGVTSVTNSPTTVNLDTPFILNAGSNNAVAIILSATANHTYTNGTGGNQNYANANLSIQTGSATNGAFSGGVNTPRVFNGSLCYYIDSNGCANTLTEQTPPNPDLGGFNSNAAGGGVSTQETADNFSVPANAAINGLRVWGVYTGTNFVPPTQNFTVRIFADSAGNPGALLYTANVNNVAVQDSGIVQTGFAGTARPMYYYDLNLPSFNATGGTTYWLSPVGTNDSFTWCWQFFGAAGNVRVRTGPAAIWNSFTSSVAFELCGVPQCYANCDGSTGTPRLTANDFQCFIDKFAANDPYANCDGSTGIPALTANDFQCFINKFAAGCP